MTKTTNSKHGVGRFVNWNLDLGICSGFEICDLRFPLALACCVFLATLAGCQSSSLAEPEQAASAAPAGAAIRVVAAPPVRKTLRLESVQPGQIEAFEHTPLWAKLPAYVEKLHAGHR